MLSFFFFFNLQTLSWLLQTLVLGEEELSQKAKSKRNATSYLFPGAVGALPCLRRPADALEGQDHISRARGVEHKVSARDVDVQELSRAAGFLRPHDVREHVETCQRAKRGEQLGGEPPAPGTGRGGAQLSRTCFPSLPSLLVCSTTLKKSLWAGAQRC